MNGETMSIGILPAELSFFSTLASCGSLSGAARELGITTPAVSKRLSLMESRIGLSLVTRTTRRMSLTHEGDVLLEHARRILGDIADLDQLLTMSKGMPKGQLRVNATPGFGRLSIAPIISRYVLQYPEVDVQLHLSVDPPPLSDDQFDVCIRFGEPSDTRIIATRIGRNRRLLCAAPAYLARHGEPKAPSELVHHNCICIRQGDEAYGVWRLAAVCETNRGSEAVKVRGNLSTNDGEIAVNWALDGHGIVMRAEWDVERYLASGRLVQVMPQYQTPDADVYAVYPQRHQLSARIRTFVDFLSQALERLGADVR